MLGLRWEDMNTKWRGLTIRDKVDGTRVIPLTPYVWRLLAALPRRNEIRPSATAAGGRIVIPRNPHHDACTVAGIDALTVHGRAAGFNSSLSNVPGVGEQTRPQAQRNRRKALHRAPA